MLHCSFMKKIHALLQTFLRLRHDPLYMNSVYMMVSTAMVSGSGFFFWMIATHLYADTQVGLATALVSVVGFIMSLSNLGFNYSVVRFMPRTKNKNRLLSTVVLFISMAAALIAGAFLSLLPFLSPQLMFIRENPLMMFFFLFFSITVAIDLATEAIFLALRKGKYIFLKNIGIVGLKLVLPILFLPFGAFGLFMAWAAAVSSALAVSTFVLIKHFKLRFTPSFKKINLRQLMAFSFTNYIVSLTGITPALVLPVIIANTISIEAAAYFYISFMIANLLYTIPQAVTQSLLAEGSHDQKKFLQSLKKAIKLLSVLLLPAILVLLLFGSLILLVFGKSYSTEGVRFLQLLAITGIPIAINAIGMTILNIHRRMKPLLAINLIGASAILLLSFVFREYALTGIGLAWLIGHGLKTILYAGYLYSVSSQFQLFRPAVSFRG